MAPTSSFVSKSANRFQYPLIAARYLVSRVCAKQSKHGMTKPNAKDGERKQTGGSAQSGDWVDISYEYRGETGHNGGDKASRLPALTSHTNRAYNKTTIVSLLYA